jgi:hypothetical protein
MGNDLLKKFADADIRGDVADHAVVCLAKPLETKSTPRSVRCRDTFHRLFLRSGRKHLQSQGRFHPGREQSISLKESAFVMRV